MTRTQTFFLGVIAASLAVLATRELVPEAHAQESAVTCETWVFDMELGKKAGAANVESHRLDMQAQLARMLAGGGRAVYASTFPIVSAMNGVTIAYSGVVCVAK